MYRLKGENMKKNSLIIDILVAAVLLAACGLACEASLFITVLPLAFVLFLVPAFLTARHGLPLGIASLVYLFAIYFAVGSKTVLLDALFIAPASLACGYSVKRRYPFYEAMFYTCISFLLGILAAVLYGQFAEGMMLGEYTVHVILEDTLIPAAGVFFLSPMLVMIRGGMSVPTVEELSKILALYSEGGVESLKEEILLEKNYTMLTDFFQSMTPMFALYAVILGGILLYAVTRAIVKKKGQPVCPAPLFSEFAYPGKSGSVMLYAFIGATLLSLFKIEKLELFAAVLQTGTMLLFMIQGYAFMNWVLRRYMGKTGAGFITVVLAAVAGIAGGYMGILEQIVKLRQKVKNDTDGTF